MSLRPEASERKGVPMGSSDVPVISHEFAASKSRPCYSLGPVLPCPNPLADDEARSAARATCPVTLRAAGGCLWRVEECVGRDAGWRSAGRSRAVPTPLGS